MAYLVKSYRLAYDYASNTNRYTYKLLRLWGKKQHNTYIRCDRIDRMCVPYNKMGKILYEPLQKRR